MEIEIRDITPEEAAPYGGNNSAVLAGRKTVVFTDADGNSGKLYMKEEEIDVLGERYIAENSTMEYSKLCDEWFPKVSWNAYKNDTTRNPPKTVDVEFVCVLEGTDTEIWRRMDIRHPFGMLTRVTYAAGVPLAVRGSRPTASISARPRARLSLIRKSVVLRGSP